METGYTMVVCEIGRETRQLKFTCNALVELEKELGIPISDFIPSEMGFRGQRALLWAGCLSEDPKLKIETVGNWLDPLLKDPEAYATMLGKVGEAYAKAFPTPKEEEPGPNAAAPGTGQ